jgi:TIR domain
MVLIYRELHSIKHVKYIQRLIIFSAHIVEEDEEEPSVPPPIFLSYQWAHQPEVKLLKRHLGNAGYSCWMDVGQMGGGDKLFAKIDKGIRAAKVIVCCVTEKYADSPNCNREVH